jgi:two-component system, NtrC family, response regulator AtoC
MLTTLLIVDDEKNTRDGLRSALEDDYDVYVAANLREAYEVLNNEQVDLVLTDLRIGAESGMDLLETVLKRPRPPVCLMMTAYGSTDAAVEAMRRGAYHFVTKPLNIDELEMLIQRGLRSRTLEQENATLSKKVEERYSVDRILGKAEVMKQVYQLIEQVAPTKATVLIEGESGTGKELAAHAIHNLSGRPKSKLVTVNCAALSPQLLESELFGHEKGAFTGATEKRIGRFEHANGGTLFLDEIGEIDASTQVKLLRAIGERTIERVGGNTAIKVDVRLVTATNKDLKQLVAEGKFREDLYFRLNVVKLKLPPLRERKVDIPLLANAFLKELSKEHGKSVRDYSPDVAQRLLEYNWPGNVRELRTAIEHAVVMATTSKVSLNNLPPTLRGEEDAPVLHRPNILALPAPGAATAFPPAAQHASQIVIGEDLNLAHMEERLIRLALARCSESRTDAAKLLGISRRTLQRKLLEMKIATVGLVDGSEDADD